MLKTPTPEALIVLEQISKLPRFRDFNDFIEAELTATMDRMIGATDTAQLHALRGRAQVLREFQTEVAHASSTLAKLGLRSPIQ